MKKAFPKCQYIGFECYPTIAYDLQKVYPGKLYNYAISDYNGVGTVYYRHRGKNACCMYPFREEHFGDGDVQVITRTLDGFFEEHGIPEGNIMLWMDCEGSELAGLQGAEKFLPHVGVVNVEVTGKPRNDGWCHPTDVHNWLNDHGFLRQHLHTQRSCIGQCDSIYLPYSLFKPEYCFCPCQVGRYEEWKKEQ